MKFFNAQGLSALVALCFCLAAQWYAAPPTPPPQLERQEERETLIAHYLIFKASDLTDNTWLKNTLDLLSRTDSSDGLLESVAMIYFMEGEEQSAVTSAQRLPPGPRRDTLLFAFRHGDDLPQDWKSHIDKDWIGAKTTELVYRRLHDAYRQKNSQDNGYSKEIAESVVLSRYFENEARPFEDLWMIYSGLAMLGFALLVAMFFSRRYQQLIGKKFFQLKALVPGSQQILTFVTYFFIAAAAITFFCTLFDGILHGALSLLVRISVVGATALFILKNIVYKDETEPISQILSFGNLQLQFFNLLQIIGAVAIIVSLYQTIGTLFSFLHWPLNRLGIMNRYQEMLTDPVAATLLIIAFCIIKPFFEEIIFRGYLLRTLKGRLKKRYAILISAFLFAALSPFHSFPTQFAVGCGLSVVYLRSANLSIPIWGHALWNGILLYFAYMDFII